MQPQAPIRKILVVPHALLGVLSSSFFDRDSVKLRTASSGREALATAALWPPALLIFSSRLGDLAAEELCHRVRESDRTRHTKLLMLSPADLDSDARAAAGRASVHAHLVHPLDPDELVSTISNLLDLRRRRAPRLRVDLPGALHLDGAAPRPVRIAGLSELGALVEARECLSIGAELELVFELVSGEPLRLRARILTGDELELRYGVEFLHSELERDILRAFVTAQLLAHVR